jgi:hypothetical protein
MSSINMDIVKEGKKLRNRTLYDVFEPAIDYPKLLQLLHQKEMFKKQFLTTNLYKKI